MTDELPTFTAGGVECEFYVAFDPDHSREATESDLSALLAALSPEQLKRVLAAQLDIRHPKCTDCGGSGGKGSFEMYGEGMGSGSWQSCGTCGGSGRPTAPLRVIG